MSYLQFPRLIFSGQFQAAPSTVNNDPEHFDTETFKPNYDKPGPGATNGWWNPDGDARWTFSRCVVEQVQYLDGTICSDPAVDPVVGMPINSNSGTPAKLVDLDSECQMVSAIWGLHVFLGAAGGQIGFGGNYATASFTYMFF